MAAVQAASSNMGQARSSRAAAVGPPPSSGLAHTRPWRSSPLAGPAFSTLPHAIPESAEEAHENDLAGSDRPRTRSPSIISQSGSLFASGYAPRNASDSASALALADGEASTSSVSLTTSTGAHGTSSSQSHASSRSHSNRPARLSKSWGRRTSLAKDNVSLPKNITSDVFIKPPPRARTAYGYSRSMSLPIRPVAPPPTIPQAYSRSSFLHPMSSPSETNNTKQPPSNSRDPASNWMSSSPFGPAQTPKFSRLAMASPAVVMPLSAREYRKQKARESLGRGKDQESSTPNHVTFIDNVLSAFQNSNGVPVVKISPPPSEDIDQPPLPSGDHSPDRRSESQLQVIHPPSKPIPPPTMSPRPPSPKQKRPRSRPNTPPRSSPLATHPPISPRSSAGTFFSFTSSEEDSFRPQGENEPTVDDQNALPPARPSPRPRRRKSYPDRLSNGARLSLLEAMDRLSQEGGSLQPLSQPDGVNRLSVLSQASGYTLFYDASESDGESGQPGQVTSQQGTSVNGNGNGHADETGRCTPVFHTQSLEDLHSTLARTGIEAVRANGDDAGNLDVSSDVDERKAKRNVRMVRISDTVEASPSPVHRRRKLTKPRPGAASAPGTELTEDPKVQTQFQERRTSLLPWKSKVSNDTKAGVGTAVERGVSASTKGVIYPSGTITLPNPHPPIANSSAEIPLKPKFNSPSKKVSSNVPTSTSPNLDPESSPSHKPRRYAFSFLPEPTFHRSKREESGSVPAGVDLGLDHNKAKFKGNIIGIERRGTDSTSTSIHTITQANQSTLVPTYDLTTLASSGGLGSGKSLKPSVPILQQLNAQEMAIGMPLQSEWDSRAASTPSLITNGSTTTSLSSPRTPSFYRNGVSESCTPRHSGLKDAYADPSEDDLDDMPGGRTSRMCMHRKSELGPMTRTGWGEVLEEDEQHLRTSATSWPGSRPGTSDSTLTTATETSDSYLSFSTLPASTSSTTSHSESPEPDKGDGTLLVQEEDEDRRACASCGHRLASPSLLRAISPVSMCDPDLEGMHPMFTVPLVTIPASPLGTYPRSRSNTTPAMQSGKDVGMGGARHESGRRNERQMSVPVPAALIPGVKTNITVPPARLSYMPIDANGRPVGTSNSVSLQPMAMAMISTTTATMTTPSVPSPARLRKKRRPQTMPAGTGDARLRFIEEARAVRVREGDVNIDAPIEVRVDRTANSRSSGESKFKAVLKGLLRWGG